MQLVHTLFKLVLLSETSQLRLHPSLYHNYYKVRSVYYSLLNFGVVQSGPFWGLKSVLAKKLCRCYKASKISMMHKCLLLVRYTASFLDSRKTLPNLEVRVDSLASIGLWTCVCSTCECDVVLNLYCMINSGVPLVAINLLNQRRKCLERDFAPCISLADASQNVKIW